MSIELADRRRARLAEEHTLSDRPSAYHSMGEMLQTALRFEHGARDFYRRLTLRVSTPVRAVVEALAEEEAHHYQTLAELADRPEVQQQAHTPVRRPPDESRFADLAKAPGICEFANEHAVLRYALDREQIALDQYRFLAGQPLPSAVGAVFARLAAEEQRHKSELSKRFYELVYIAPPIARPKGHRALPTRPY